MKKIQRFLAGIFLLAVLLLGLMPVSTKAAALKGTDPCYKITPQLTSASWKYIDEIYRQTKSVSTDAYTTLAGEEQIGLIWVSQYAWTRLYGIVVLEVFKQIEQETIDSGMFFRLTLSEIAERLGIKDTDQLDAIFTAESKR